MSDLTTDEVRTVWVAHQMLGIDLPKQQFVRIVSGLMIHFDGWLAGERWKARLEMLDALEAEILALPDALAPGPLAPGKRATVVESDDILAILAKARG